jgi:hypothetical protein
MGLRGLSRKPLRRTENLDLKIENGIRKLNHGIGIMESGNIGFFIPRAASRPRCRFSGFLPISIIYLTINQKYAIMGL